MNILQLTTIGEEAVLKGIKRDEARGGLEKIVISLNKRILQRGHVVIIVCCSEGYFSNMARESGLNVKVVKTVWIKFFGKHLFPLLSLFKVLELARKNKINIIHCANFASGLIGGLVAKLCRIPMVISVHGQISIKSQTNHDKFYILFVLKRGVIMAMRKLSAWLSSRIITVSNMSKIDLIKNKFNSNKITTIVNAIDLENYNFSVSPDRIKNQLSLHNGTFIVGAIGRLIEDKGFKYFIDSFKKVYRNIPNVKFLIVGDGPERINLESLRTVRNFKDKIIFTGFRDDIQQTYACLDVLVQPSLLEGFSGVLLEGMAMRKPVIATEACGDMNLFKHLENIVIVKPADSDAIADAIITLYKDRSLREKIALNGCNFVENKFNASLWSDKYLNVFSELVAKRKC